MNFKLFSELYEEAKKYMDLEEFIENHTSNDELLLLVQKRSIDIVSLLRFVYEVAHMNIKGIREYLGMTRPKFCEYYEIRLRTLEDWEYEKNPTPQRWLKLLSYTLIENFLS